jgi:protein-tyrosine-phosphatase
LIPAFLSRNANTTIKKSLLPISNGKDKLNTSTSSLDLEVAIRKPENKTSEHDIRVHLEKIHKKKFEIEDPYLKKLDEFNKLRRLVRKL